MNSFALSFCLRSALLLWLWLCVSASASAQLDSLLAMRRSLAQTALQSPIPVIPCQDKLSGSQLSAAELMLQQPSFTKYTRAENGVPYLNEIFGVYPARQSDLPPNTPLSPTQFRVEMYNYALNLATYGVIDIQTQQVLNVAYMPATQPDIPAHLRTVAIQLAIESAAVQTALGFKPTPQNALMANTKTALNRSRCERSLHLCVAPTFVKDNKALWTIVDLTDLKVVGTRWTNVGRSEAVTERRYQNANMMECYCLKDSSVTRGDWQFKFMLTSSDGLRISEVHYKNQLVISSAKLVDFHVNYSNADGFGYSDAIGCPMFSQAAVVAITPPQLREWEADGRKGFCLEQNYFSEGWPAPCNYNYLQRYEFYDDGSFRLAIGSLGRGCGNDGTYRPVSRIAFAQSQFRFYEWNAQGWTPWQQEGWQLQTELTAYTPEKYQYKLATADQHGYYIMANVGQFSDGGRGDNAYLYVTKHHFDKDEGNTDLVTIGPCCNVDYRQGPEKFIEPAPDTFSPQGDDLVVWYVPQLKNDDTPGREYCWAQSYIAEGLVKSKVYPCMSGVLFVPIR